MFERTKHIILDLLGVLLMLISPLFGWLPGPGGIPIFIAGLALLAVNHEWAKRWLTTIRQKGINLADYIFVKHPIWEAFYDIATVILVVIGVHIVNTYTNSLIITIGILLFVFALFLFLGNRRRIQRLIKKIKT